MSATVPAVPAPAEPPPPDRMPAQPACDQPVEQGAGAAEFASIVREAITSPSREVFVRLVLLLVVVAALVMALHLVGVPLPWAAAA